MIIVSNMCKKCTYKETCTDKEGFAKIAEALNSQLPEEAKSMDMRIKLDCMRGAKPTKGM